MLTDVDNTNVIASMDRALARDAAFAEGGTVRRFVLPAADLAGQPVGRTATPDDLEALAVMLDRTHGREFLWPGRRPEWLRDRMSRTDAYSWPKIRFTERALLGTWLADERRTVINGGGRPHTYRRALVLDHAVVDGGDDDFEALVRSACADALTAGLAELVVVTGAENAASAVFERLARRVDVLANTVVYLDLPDDLAERGTWIDPIYV